MTDALQIILEIIGTIAFAVSGAMAAIEKRMDILGVAVMGVVTAVGGGVLRDVLLGYVPPRAFTNPIYAVLAVVTALIVFMPALRQSVEKKQVIVDAVLLIMDSLGLGIFTVVGIAAAKESFDNWFLLLFVGVITGVGGGVLRDTLSGATPAIFRKHFYCTASIIGAALSLILWPYLGREKTMLFGAGTVFVLRILAAHYRWNLPKA